MYPSPLSPSNYVYSTTYYDQWIRELGAIQLSYSRGDCGANLGSTFGSFALIYFFLAPETISRDKLRDLVPCVQSRLTERCWFLVPVYNLWRGPYVGPLLHLSSLSPSLPTLPSLSHFRFADFHLRLVILWSVMRSWASLFQGCTTTSSDNDLRTTVREAKVS